MKLGKILLVGMVFIGLLGSSWAGTYGGGSGTPEDPYQIGTPEHLITLGQTPEDYDKCFVMTADIDLSGYEFDRAVIAPDVDDTEEWYWFHGTPFTGIFDGGGHKILNLKIEGGGYLGLFGMVVSPGNISNLGLEDVDIFGTGKIVGGLCSGNGVLYLLHGGIINDCYVTGSVISSGEFVGGFVGTNWYGYITGSFSSATVSGGDRVGGLAGINWGGCITGSYSTGTVTGWYEVGGLVGENDGENADCYSTGTVIGYYFLGGLVGSNKYHGVITASYSTGTIMGAENSSYIGGLVGCNEGSIATSYSTGMVTGGYNVGGLVGTNWCHIDGSGIGGCSTNHSGETSFWDMQSSGLTESACGTGKTTAEMKTLSTFTDAGWDFIDVWDIGEGQTYPYLRTNSAADINKDEIVNLHDLYILAEQWMKVD